MDKDSDMTIQLRHHKNSDIDRVIKHHGMLYKMEYGWDNNLKTLVAQICADFVLN